MAMTGLKKPRRNRCWMPSGDHQHVPSAVDSLHTRHLTPQPVLSEPRNPVESLKAALIMGDRRLLDRPDRTGLWWPEADGGGGGGSPAGGRGGGGYPNMYTSK